MKQTNLRILLLGIAFIVGFVYSHAQLAKIGVFLSSGQTLTYEVSDNPQITYGDNDVTIKTLEGSKTYQMSQINKIAFINRVESIVLSQNHAEIELGQILQLTATILPDDAENKELEWSSSNDKVAMVSSTGKVVALEEGEATIAVKAKDGSNVSASCTISVVPVRVKSITLNYSSYVLEKGESITLEVTILPANAVNKTLNWRSSDDSILMVNSRGTVFCLEEGSATITASTTDGSNLSTSCLFNCTNAISFVNEDEQSVESIYSINGVKTLYLQKGINIIRTKDGEIKKQMR